MRAYINSYVFLILRDQSLVYSTIITIKQLCYSMKMLRHNKTKTLLPKS